MILFELDGVLSNHSHRLHLIDSKKNSVLNGNPPRGWKPDFYEFFNQCHKDEEIREIGAIFRRGMLLSKHKDHFGWQIWTSRPEEFREKTVEWLIENLSPIFSTDRWNEYLKMNEHSGPVDDDKWFEIRLGEYLHCHEYMNYELPEIEMAFVSNEFKAKVCRGFGIFALNCNQDYK